MFRTPSPRCERCKTPPLRLNAAALEREAGVPVLKLDWSIDGPIDPSQTVFVHLRDSQGQIAAQADGEPISGYAPFSMWPTGTRLQERRPLFLPPDLPAGKYTVVVGLYNRDSLRPTLPAQSESATPDGAVIVDQIER